MIHWPNLLRILGSFLLALALGLSIALGVSLAFQDDGVQPLATTASICLVVGAGFVIIFRRDRGGMNNREGILLVITVWVSACLVGALPYYLADLVPFTDAVFESVSGFTATGATILRDIESVPRGLLFWRSLSQWVGGMGIILMVIAILPLFSSGGMQLYRAEFTGARSEKLKPRFAETARALWKIYAVFTAIACLALRLAGMSTFDAVCHSFTVMSTAGFSTKNASIEGFASPAIEVVVIGCMLMAGINFTQHYRLFVQRRPGLFLRDLEIRAYLSIVLAATTAVTLTLHFDSGLAWTEGLRKGLFQVVSIMTTTGYSTADYEQWSPFAKLILLALMFVGGCTGSTTGGLKVVRIVMLMKVVGREFRRIVERRGVFSVKLSGEAVGETVVQALLNLVYLAFIINFTACLILTAFGVDILTAISAVAAAMFNIGPALGGVGPSETYAHMAGPVKWILAVCMLAGRLEYYALIVVCTREFWRK